MKVIIEQVPDNIENEIIVRCHKMDESIQDLLRYLEWPTQRLLGKSDDQLYVLEPDKVFYVEAVDSKIFIYGEQQVYESNKRLYELEEELEGHGFFRASKSMILNISKIKSVRPLFDGRVEALLKNKEKVYISRKYVSVLKQKLGI